MTKLDMGGDKTRIASIYEHKTHYGKNKTKKVTYPLLVTISIFSQTPDGNSSCFLR
jgi:hypothetical protein